MDEVEKALSQSNSDDGLSQRVLDALLTWMARHSSKVFIVATSNNIERLSPELVRKGRLDEIFFVDLPKPEVRREILEFHLHRRNRPPCSFDLNSLTHASEDFTNAEIEQAIVSSLYAAHAQEDQLDTLHLLEEMERTSPLSVVMAEKVQYLRDWAADRTVPAD